MTQIYQVINFRFISFQERFRALLVLTFAYPGEKKEKNELFLNKNKNGRFVSETGVCVWKRNAVALKKKLPDVFVKQKMRVASSNPSASR